MAYHDKLLYPGERIRSMERPHPAALIGTGLLRIGQLAAIAIFVRAAGGALVERLVNSPALRELGPGGGPLPIGEWASTLGWILVATVLLAAGLDVLRWKETVYLLTDLRILHVFGALSKASVDSPLDKITDVGLEQSWLGRLLDYGDVLILRNTEDGGNRLPAVARPAGFKAALHKARSTRVAPNGPPNLQAALKELIQLREHGLVTPEEFDQKKRDLLARF